jgi:hypothetical protein
MSNLWQCLESIEGLVGVPALWRCWLISEFDVFKPAFLRRRDGTAQSYPCSTCGCAHEVVRHADGDIIAVCQCDPCSCEDISLRVDDLVLLELNWQKFGRAIAAALGCDKKEATFGLAQTAQVAAFSGAALPIVLTIQTGTSSMQSVVGRLVAKLRERFVLLAPTSRFVDAHVRSMLTNAKAGFFDLESHLKLTVTGAFQANKSAGDLFSSFVADAKEPASDDEARRVFALLKELEDRKVVKAPVIQVFRLYCMEGLSRAQVAKQCHCVPGLITKRLKQIEQKLGRKPAELRKLSGHFEKIDESLRDDRARKVRRRSAIDDDSFSDERD